MSDEDDAANVFAIPDFWKASKWLEDPMSNWSTQFFSLDFKDYELPGTEQLTIPTVEGFFKLPVLDPVPDEPPSLIEDHSTHHERSALEELDNFGDVWLQLRGPLPKIPEYKTWDAFTLPDSAHSKPLFITEAGPGAFDALIGMELDPLGMKNFDYTVVDATAYSSALLSLALGRESVFFSWHTESKSFKPTISRMRVSGYSGHVLQGVQQNCLDCGNACRNLRSYVESTYTKHPTPCRVALASAVDRILLVVQSSVALNRQTPRSILQLQSLVHRLSAILLHFELLVTKIRRSHVDEDILVMVFQQAQAAENGERFLRDIMREVLQRVSRPWVDFVEEWIGTKPEVGVPLRNNDAGRHKGFVRVESEVYVDDFGDEVEDLDFRLDQDKMPNFMPEDVAQALFETGRNFRFIKSSHPEHALSRQDIVSSSHPPVGEWLFDWDSILQLEARVRGYELALTNAIRNCQSDKTPDSGTLADPSVITTKYELHVFGADEIQLQDRLLASIQHLAQPMTEIAAEDPLARVIRECLSVDEVIVEDIGTDFTPHWSLLPILSFGSLISAQARVVGRESMKLLLGAHDLKGHLKLQRDFHLLGNGIFCSRLSHALFDPDLETAERQAGVARQGGVMGLRLSGRDTWPPASSELRLALMGVLTESYSKPHQADRSPGSESSELPGDLSFAVRDLSSEEIDKCLDPDSLEALDFLRLSYKPPSALTSIITPVILVQYDRVFRLLLRVLRMLYTVNQLFRDVTARTSRWQEPENASVRFSFEAHHFISSISSYFFDTGIGMPWQAFERFLDQTEVDLNNDSPESVSGPTPSPDRLREYHSHILDRIMLALLLRKRQQPVLKLLEEIFRVILQFAKQSRLRAAGGDGTEDNDGSEELYKAFRKNVEVFITVCKGLTEKGNYGTKQEARGMRNDFKTKDDLEENTIALLLLKLDMFNYYSKG